MTAITVEELNSRIESMGAKGSKLPVLGTSEMPPKLTCFHRDSLIARGDGCWYLRNPVALAVAAENARLLAQQDDREAWEWLQDIVSSK
jgi:hypothetical protein